MKLYVSYTLDKANSQYVMLLTIKPLSRKTKSKRYLYTPTPILHNHKMATFILNKLP